MKKLIPYIPTVASYFFILLFCYAAISKAVDFENFQVQIGQSPLLSAYAGFISCVVIILELFIVLLLIYPKANIFGLYASTALMSAFTIYIFLILNYSDFVPCSCGGILEKLGWTEHLIFNILCVLFGGIAVWIEETENNRRTKRTAVLLGASNILSCLMIVLLFFSSEHIIKKDNNFTRRFLQYPVIEDKSLPLDNDHYYFAGEDSNHIYLGSDQYPQILTAISKDLETKSTLKITPENLNYPFKSIKIIVQTPYYYFTDGTVPIIFRGKLGNPYAKEISYKDAFFSQITVKDSTHFIIRTFDRTTRDLTLASLSLNSSPKVQLHQGFIRKQKDGVFDSDGQLHYSSNPFKIMYLYNYRNQFTIADGNLNILQNLNTIDTVTTAKIETKKLSDGRHKMVAPPLQVNQRISSQGKLTFIQSALMGKNESSAQWKKTSVIDIYRNDKNEYVGSFYIYNNGDTKVSDYLAGKDHFYSIIGKKLVRYNYRKPLIQNLKTGEAENLNKE